jgi:hypothetical protein
MTRDELIRVVDEARERRSRWAKLRRAAASPLVQLCLLAAALLVAAWALEGCASARDGTVTAATVSATAGDAAHAALAAAYEAEQRACLPGPTPRACVEGVRADYEPAWAAYAAYRSAWLALAAGIATVDAGGEPVSLVPLVARLLEAERAMRAALPVGAP